MVANPAEHKSFQSRRNWEENREINEPSFKIKIIKQIIVTHYKQWLTHFMVCQALIFVTWHGKVSFKDSFFILGYTKDCCISFIHNFFFLKNYNYYDFHMYYTIQYTIYICMSMYKIYEYSFIRTISFLLMYVWKPTYLIIALYIITFLC